MKWHEKPINVIIVTILFWPLGVYYMWLNKMFFFKNTTEEPEESKASGDVAPSDEKRLQEKQEEVEIDDELDEDDPSDEKRLQEKQEEVVEIDGEEGEMEDPYYNLKESISIYGADRSNPKSYQNLISLGKWGTLSLDISYQKSLGDKIELTLRTGAPNGTVKDKFHLNFKAGTQEYKYEANSFLSANGGFGGTGSGNNASFSGKVDICICEFHVSIQDFESIVKSNKVEWNIDQFPVSNIWFMLKKDEIQMCRDYYTILFEGENPLIDLKKNLPKYE